MSETTTRKLTAVLAGVALALLVVAAVVQKAAGQALSPCHACGIEAARQGDKDCKHIPPGSAHHHCRYKILQAMCYKPKADGSGTEPCPDPFDVSTQRNCSSASCRDTNGLPEGFCDNDPEAGTQCNSDCYSKNCNQNTGRCGYAKASRPAAPGEDGYGVTLCGEKCGCK